VPILVLGFVLGPLPAMSDDEPQRYVSVDAESACVLVSSKAGALIDVRCAQPTPTGPSQQDSLRKAALWHTLLLSLINTASPAWRRSPPARPLPPPATRRTPEEFAESHAPAAVNIPFMLQTDEGRKHNPEFLTQVSPGL
jgi:rhodanese-related sulfurtransferase